MQNKKHMKMLTVAIYFHIKHLIYIQNIQTETIWYYFNGCSKTGIICSSEIFTLFCKSIVSEILHIYVHVYQLLITKYYRIRTLQKFCNTKLKCFTAYGSNCFFVLNSNIVIMHTTFHLSTGAE